MEVTRTTDNQYWAHISVERAMYITDSRIDYDYEGYIKRKDKIPPLPDADHIVKMAVKIGFNPMKEK